MESPLSGTLISLPEGAGAAILEALGDASIRIQDKISDGTLPKKNRNVTQRDAIVKARVGQGKFRDDVLKMWNNQCPVRGPYRSKAVGTWCCRP